MKNEYFYVFKGIKVVHLNLFTTLLLGTKPIFMLAVSCYNESKTYRFIEN